MRKKKNHLQIFRIVDLFQRIYVSNKIIVYVNFNSCNTHDVLRNKHANKGYNKHRFATNRIQLMEKTTNSTYWQNSEILTVPCIIYPTSDFGHT